MPLSNAQIERYSRQIVVPGFGGRAQQRLLAAEIAVLGAYDDVAMPLRYLAGAGVGTIHVDRQSAGPRADELIARVNSLNPDVAVDGTLSSTESLVFALVGDAASRGGLVGVAARGQRSAFVVARLDTPGKIAVMRAIPPCPVCADADLVAPAGQRVQQSHFVAMVAATEALKLAAGLGDSRAACIIEFSGYESRARPLGIAEAGHCGTAAKHRGAR